MSSHGDPHMDAPVYAPQTGYRTPDSGYTVQPGFAGNTGRRSVPALVVIASVLLFLTSVSSMLGLIGRMLEVNILVRSPLMADLWLIFESSVIALAVASAAAGLLFGRELGRVFAITMSGVVLFSSASELMHHPMSMVPAPALPLLDIALAIAVLAILPLPQVSTWYYLQRVQRKRTPFSPVKQPPTTDATQSSAPKPAAFHICAVLLLGIGVLLITYSGMQFLLANYSFELWPRLGGIELVGGVAAIVLGVLTFTGNGVGRLLALAVAAATAWSGLDLFAVNLMYVVDWGVYDGLQDPRYWISMVLLFLSAVTAIVVLFVLGTSKCADWVHEKRGAAAALSRS